MAMGDDLSLLAQVIEAGGFTAASRRTGIPKSRLSRRIADLETRLGVTLIHRDARRFAVTELGLRLYRHGAAIRAEAEAAALVAQEALAEPSGPLRVACPVVLAELIIGRLSAEFAAAHPLVQLNLTVTTGVEEIMPPGCDLMIRPTPSTLADSTLVARRLLVAPFVLVATPAWVAAADHPRNPAQLNGRDGVGWWQQGDAPRWQLQDLSGAAAEIAIRPRFVTDNLMVARDGALAGLGLARLSRHIVEDDLSAGRLVEALPGWAPPPMTFYAVYPSPRALKPVGRRFLDHLAAGLDARYS